MGDPKALMSLVKNNPDPMVRMLAINGLVENADDAVTLVLVDALQDTDSGVRANALAGLGLMARNIVPGEIPALVKCLQDKDSWVSLYAASLLYGQPGGAEAALPELKKMLKSRNADLRNAATDALKDYNPQKAAENQHAAAALKPETHPILDIPPAYQKPSEPLPTTPYEVLGIFIENLAITRSEELGNKWTATVKVLDDAGTPVQGADVSVTYYVPDVIDQDLGPNWRKIEGRTDNHGIFVATHKDSSSGLVFDVLKAGYYSTNSSHQFLFPGQADNEKMSANRNPTVTLVLKKIIVP